jgi:hypothetical protein
VSNLGRRFGRAGPGASGRAARGPAPLAGPRGKRKACGPKLKKKKRFSIFFQKQYLYEFDEYLNEFE